MVYVNVEDLIRHSILPGALQGDVGSREVRHLQKQNLKLTEENNLLKYKVELLMDMVGCVCVCVFAT